MTRTPHQTRLAPRELAGLIDQTLLAPEAGAAAIETLCAEAAEYGFAAVCVHPCHVRRAARLLAGRTSKVCSVVGFPCGANHSLIKQAEAAQAIADGAAELDMVINLAAALEGDVDYVRRDVEAVLRVCRPDSGAIVLKVILETAALPRETKVNLCRLADNLGVDFVKTSTGLHPAGGATIADVRLLYAHRGRCLVKAAGGIRDLPTALAMLETGAQRIGTSSGVAIIEELKKQNPSQESA